MNIESTVSFDRLERAASFGGEPLYVGFDMKALALQRPDTHLVYLRDGRPCARASVWWSDSPQGTDGRTGAIGHYAALDDAAASAVLDAACARLAEEGCALAIGPMDGNTWRRYRFVTDRGVEPPFFMEPDNPDDYPAQWESGGFERESTYYSGLVTDLTRRDPRLGAVEERMDAEGVRLRTFDPDDAEAELGRIYRISIASFTRNHLYTPLPEEEFREQYRAVMPYGRPELTILAEQDGEPVGFMFALPDLAQAQRGEEIDTVILKTAAILPERRHAGLGALLVERVQLAAADMGFCRGIHALMYESNTSRAISAHYATTMRRYTLYSKRLTP
jgi:GNAT superfamily N-acetyltransferase